MNATETIITPTGVTLTPLFYSEARQVEPGDTVTFEFTVPAELAEAPFLRCVIASEE